MSPPAASEQGAGRPSDSAPPGLLRRLLLSRPGVAGAGMLFAMLLIAAGADFLASDKPLAMRLDGRLYLLPNLTQPAALRADDLESLRARLRPERGDWLLAPPVPFGPYQTDLGLPALPAPPDARHLLGTDEVGRDVLARLVHGTRTSLAVALGAVLFALLAGVGLGLLAGYFGRWVDVLISRLVEVMLTFPTLVLALAIMAVVERPRLPHVVLAIGLTRWPEMARLVRGEVLRLRGLDFVLAARGLGASDARIVFGHVLPNALGPAIVAAAFGAAGAILAESGLSFLGLGVPPPVASWGELLSQASRYALAPGAWWLAVFPGSALTLTVAAFNLLGDGLRVALDPRAAVPKKASGGKLSLDEQQASG